MLIGPIFSRELAVAPRRLVHYVYRTAYPLVLFVLMGTAWVLMVGTQNVRNVADIARFGSMLFQMLALLQLALLSFLAAQSAVSGVAQEKDKRTMLLLLMTRLSNHELVLGKLFASLLDVFVMLLAGLPVFMLMTLFGGISLEQVLQVFAITLATVLAVGSLGTTVALGREKTFQSLAITVLASVAWLGAWLLVDLVLGNQEIAGLNVHKFATAVSPIQAIWAAVHPFEGVADGIFAAESLFVLFAVGTAGLMSVIGIVMLRVWNPGREVHPGQTEESAAGIFSADHDVKQLEQRQAAGSVTQEVADAARAAHVDARIRSVNQKSREVWDNPVLWREMCTWAYGRKVLFMRLGYVLLFVMAAAVLYSQVASGAALERIRSGDFIPVAVPPLAAFFLVSIVVVNALAVTSITNERDGGALDLLLVTDLTPKEFIFGKMLGVAYVTKEMILLPLALCVYLWWAGGMSLENLIYVIIGQGVMNFFVIMLGVHSGLTYANSRSAIGVSLGNVFFLFLGVVTLILLMISFSNSFQTQLGPFLAFIGGGGIGLFVTLGFRNASSAVATASIILPFATFFAVTSFLAGHWAQVFLVTSFAYGFTTAALLIPALSQFDVAMGRTKGGAEE